MVSRAMVRRIYYNDDKDKFLLVVSNLFGNKKIIAKPGDLVVNNHSFYNHKVGSTKLYISQEHFVKGVYYHWLLGKKL